MRTLIPRDPFSDLFLKQQWYSRGTWPASWVSIATTPPAPFVVAYRLGFTLKDAAKIRIHVSADERYDLHLDGLRLGRGPERGDVLNWFFETFDLDLTAGDHVIVAKVWSQGDGAPFAQMSLRHGFLFVAEGTHHESLSTGHAPWEGAILSGYQFLPSGMTWGAGVKVDIDAREYPWGIESGRESSGTAIFHPVIKTHPAIGGAAKYEIPVAHRLHPATLPAQIEERVRHIRVRHVDAVSAAVSERSPVLEANCISAEREAWQQLLNSGTKLLIPPKTHRRIVLDFEDYQCVYPAITLGGGTGATVRMHWAEGLYEGIDGPLTDGGATNARGKANRDIIENRCFIGVGDIFRPTTGYARRFEPLWWSAGRYVELCITTEEQSLIIEGLTFDETRYPLSMEGSIEGSDPRWHDVTKLSVRTLQNCAHETYMDCPYYEQLQYLGDTRLQILVSYTMTPDDRLARKALLLGFASIINNRGLTQSRYPSRTSQIIPPFALWWVSMLYDHGLWRNDKALVQQLMPGARLVLDTFLGLIDERGLMKAPLGWNFTDWVPEWTQTTRDYRNWGVPPDGEFGISAVLNWHLVYTLSHAAKLEEWLGQTDLSARYHAAATTLSAAIEKHFWNASRGLYADDLKHEHYSEHAQCLALLSGYLPKGRIPILGAALFSDEKLARTTIYFSHYLFEAAALTGRIEPLFKKMESMWFSLPGLGLKALPEEPEPCRSDCHAWGAHPLYHYYASVLGIRPAALGSNEWTVRPRLGPLMTASGKMPHPSGMIEIQVHQKDGTVISDVKMPVGQSVAG